MTRVVLSHPLPIIALVGHYPANKLIGRRPLHRWNHTFGPETLSGITPPFDGLSQTGGYVSTYYCPFRHSCIATRVRLACLIHAANVHSEPESNPSIGIYMNVDKPSELLRLTRLRYEPFETDLNG